jgi:23S rRNA (cytidine1920-2'-O)/16S rRNA (cytidine1409-2'-O)-methyltransferase
MDEIDLVLIDVSFISLRLILPTVYKLSGNQTKILAMFKPQFEADSTMKNKGIIKNAHIRRDLIKDFERWLKLNKFYIIKSLDSRVSGTKGNLERFFLLKKSL